MSRSWLYALVGLAAVVIAGWLPVYVRQQYNPPKEEAKYVRPVFGEHTVSQTFRTEQAIGALEVQLRSDTPQPVVVRLTDEGGTVQQEKTVRLTMTDEWVHFRLTSPLPAGEHTLTLSADTVVERAEAVLVRYQAQSDIYGDGIMLIDEQPSYGDIGFRLLARVPAWKAVMIFGQITDKAAWRGLHNVIAAVAIIGTLFGFGWLIERSKRTLPAGRQAQRWVAVLLLSLVVVTMAVRLPYLTKIEGVFGGDAFNYLSKAQAAVEGKDPFSADPRKGPVYSAFLIPGFFTPDPLMWSRLVGITAAAVAVVLLTLVLREFGLGWELAAAAGLLLALNQDFIWESPSGLANVMYTAFILAVVLAYLKRWRWWLAVLLGLTFLTRYEGAVLAPLFLGALWWRDRLPWKKAILLILVTLGVMLLPQVSYIWSGVPGIRTAGDVLEDDGLSVAGSAEAAAYNLNRFHLFLRNVWLSDETHNGVLPALGVGLLVGAALSGLQLRWPNVKRRYGFIWSIGFLLALGVLLFTKSSEARVLLVALPFFLMGLGVVPWFWGRRYDAGVILLALVIHTAVIVQILPKARYFLPLVPFMALSMTFGLQQLFAWDKKTVSRRAPLIAVAFLVVILFSDGRNTLERRVERYNTYAAEVSVMLQAVEYLHGQHGNIGFKTGAEQTIVTFIPEKRRYIWHLEPWQKEGIGSESVFIVDHKLRYLVERAGEQQWQIIRAYPTLFEHAHTFDSIYGEGKVEVYRAHPERLVLDPVN